MPAGRCTWIRARRTRPDRGGRLKRQCTGAQQFELRFGFLEPIEGFFGVAEAAVMDLAAIVLELGGVEDVEHFVEHDVLDGEAWGIRAVEEAAEDDGLVGWVPVAEVGS